jgi:hypothetical protein
VARFDSGARADSGIRFDEETSSPKPKPKRKSMRIQLYFPVRIGDQIVWLRNAKTKLPAHATTLGLDPADVTARLLDIDNALYALEAYRGTSEPSLAGPTSASTTC